MRGWGVRNDELAMRAAFIKNTMLGEAPSVMMTARRRLVLFLLNRTPMPLGKAPQIERNALGPIRNAPVYNHDGSACPTRHVPAVANDRRDYNHDGSACPTRLFHPNHFTLNHLPSWGPIPHFPLHIPRNQTGSRLGSAATLVFCNRYSATYQFVANDRKSPTKICYQFVAQTCKHLVLWRL